MTRFERLFNIITAIVMIAVMVLMMRQVLPQKEVPQPPVPPMMPPVPPPSPEPPKTDPWNAIMRISRPGVGCSATIIGPRRDDGRYWVLTAAHCCGVVGERWSGTLRTGQTLGFKITTINRTSDFAWGVSDVNSADYPYALLAEHTPNVGEAVYHGGYGVDQPGNKEDGVLRGGPNTQGQLEFELSVSSGDSGGGIIYSRDGAVLSCVCCTSSPGRRGRVFGTSPEAARRGQTSLTDGEEWRPIPIPVLPQKEKE